MIQKVLNKIIYTKEKDDYSFISLEFIKTSTLILLSQIDMKQKKTKKLLTIFFIMSRVHKIWKAITKLQNEKKKKKSKLSKNSFERK